jgi:hypothetical protein
MDLLSYIFNAQCVAGVSCHFGWRRGAGAGVMEIRYGIDGML